MTVTIYEDANDVAGIIVLYLEVSLNLLALLWYNLTLSACWTPPHKWVSCEYKDDFFLWSLEDIVCTHRLFKVEAKSTTSLEVVFCAEHGGLSGYSSKVQRVQKARQGNVEFTSSIFVNTMSKSVLGHIGKFIIDVAMINMCHAY